MCSLRVVEVDRRSTEIEVVSAIPERSHRYRRGSDGHTENSEWLSRVSLIEQIAAINREAEHLSGRSPINGQSEVLWARRAAVPVALRQTYSPGWSAVLGGTQF